MNKPDINSAFPREGIIAALWLPVDAAGLLDRQALAEHFAWLRGCGIHGVMALGSSGRFPLMDLRQRRVALETIVSLAGPLPVIANVSDIRPQVVAELARAARSLGVAGIAVMPPFFYRVSDADQLAFFGFAAEAADLPVLLYNFPEMTGNRISPETVAAFADNHPMAAIKQSGAEFDYHRELIRLGSEKGFSVFSGADTRLAEVFALGAAGCIGGLVNLVPEYMVAQFNHFRRGLPMDAGQVAGRMAEVGRIVNQLSLPHNVMAGVRARGWGGGEPTGVISASTLGKIDLVAAELQARFAEWGLEPGPHALSPTTQTTTA